MNLTNIEWVLNPDGSQGYTWNPMSGCVNHTPEGLCLGGLFPCYAWKLAHTRLKQRYLANTNTASPAAYFGCLGENAIDSSDPFYPRFWEERLQDLHKRKQRLMDGEPKPIGIFPCDMGDLFGIGVPEKWTERIMETIWDNDEYDRFYLLTKQPQNLIKFSPSPPNCFVGVTATDYWKYVDASNYLSQIDAEVKYISLEPLLSWDKEPSYFFQSSGVSWLIIGACTGTQKEMTNLARNNKSFLSEMPFGNRWTAQPNPDWLREIIRAADKAGTKVFLKDNLRPLLIPDDCSKPNYLTEDIFWASEKAQLRQEMP